MSGLFLRILGSRRRLMDGVVRLVAEQSVAAVCRVVSSRISGMSMCEARGYIRARAGLEIRRQSRLALSRELGADADWENAVVARATERVVAQVMRQLVVRQLTNCCHSPSCESPWRPPSSHCRYSPKQRWPVSRRRRDSRL